MGTFAYASRQHLVDNRVDIMHFRAFAMPVFPSFLNRNFHLMAWHSILLSAASTIDEQP
jgi:hypothetical protein